MGFCLNHLLDFSFQIFPFLAASSKQDQLCYPNRNENIVHMSNNTENIAAVLLGTGEYPNLETFLFFKNFKYCHE